MCTLRNFLCGTTLLLLYFSGQAAWKDVVLETQEDWELVRIRVAYKADDNWRYLPEAGVWIYVYQPPTPLPAPEGFVAVASGSLLMSMGQTSVQSFFVAATEVTWAEWVRVQTWAVANGYDLEGVGTGCGPLHPVHSVSWFEALKWCNALSEMEGLAPVYTVAGQPYRTGNFTPVFDRDGTGYRLPTEAEWEFAARGGRESKNYIYSGSNTLDDVAWFRDSSINAVCDLDGGRGTWPVGRRVPNEIGLYDMSGNVLEWVWDPRGSLRMARGGHWLSRMDECRVDYNFVRTNPDYRSNRTGLRVFRSRRVE